MENVVGGDADDLISGNAANNALYGGAGNDQLDGGAGDDLVSGGDGNDRLSGGLGASSSSTGQTLKPGPEGQDLWVTDVFTYSDNYGVDNDRLRVGGWGDHYNALLKFALTDVTVTQVTSATLRLYNLDTGVSPARFFLDKLNTGWNESYGWHDYTLAYTNLSLQAAPGLGWIEIDVTAVVNAWLADPTSNFGLQLRAADINNNFDAFVSSDMTGDQAAFRPELVLNYTSAAVSSGNDTLDGGEGIDTADYATDLSGLSLNLANGTATGAGIGTDTLAGIENATGGAGADTMVGDAGNNVLNGGFGADYLVGLAGNDTLIGGVGQANTLQGGLGNDTYRVEAVGDSVLEYAGEGYDEIQTTLSFYLLVAQVEKLVFTGAGAFTGIGNGLANVIVGGTAADYLIGGGGNDVLIGGVGQANALQGGVGDDTYAIEAVGDSVLEFAGEGHDEIQTTLGAFLMPANIERLIYTGGGDFTGTGSSQANTIVGGAGADHLIGAGGNDTLSGGGGAANILRGGTGDDIFLVAAVGDTIIEFAGEGFDELRTSLSTMMLAANVEKLAYTGVGAFTGIGNGDANVIVGGTGADYLIGGGGDDVLIGGVGQANAVQGGTGNDTYAVEAVGDSVIEFAGEGYDTVQTTLGTFALPGHIERLIYTGAASFTGIGNGDANVIIGGTGADYLIGGGGNDVLIGGVGKANTVQGGTGNDTYAVEAVGDSVIEFAGEGYDTVQTTLSFYLLAAEVEKLVYTGGGSFTGIGNGLANVIVGGTAADYLIGGGANDLLIGGVGQANTLQGGVGDDIYAIEAVGDSIIEFAGEGYDQIQTTLSSYRLAAEVEKLVYTGGGSFTGIGNSGANVMVGGAFDDRLTGGGGADRFVYTQAAGHDVITDFMAVNASAEHDLIDLFGRGLAFASLVITASGADTLVTLASGDSILLLGVSASQVDAGDFLF